MNFLQGLGSLAGGLTQGLPEGMGIAQQMQQNQGQEAAGQALIQLYGGAGQQPVNAPPNLFGGQGQQQQAPPPQIPQGPQAGSAQAPQPPPNLVAPQQNFAPQQSPRIPPSQAIPQGQPATAQPSATLPIPQPAPQPAPPQQPPSQLQPQQAPQQPPPQIGGGGQGMQQGGMLSLPQIIQGIMKTNPRANGRQVFQAVNALTPIMNAQGLQQYRAIADQIRAAGLGIQEERLGIEAQKAGNLQDWRSYKRNIEGVDRETKGVEKQAQENLIAQGKIMQSIMMSSTATDQDKQKASDAYQKAINVYNQVMEGVNQKRSKAMSQSPDEDSGGSDGSEKDQDLANAKQYIEKGADKAKVIKKLKDKYPDIDTSGL